MRPVEYTDDQIIAAGEALMASGRSVTGFAIRQRIGGGNVNRLKQVWDEYLASKSAKEADVVDLPVEVADKTQAAIKRLEEELKALVLEINAKAVMAAERRVAEVVRQAEEQRALAEQEQADAEQMIVDLETRLAEQQAKAAADAELHADYRARMEQEVAQLTDQLRQLRAEIDSVRQAATTAAAQAEVLRQQNAALLDAIKQKRDLPDPR